MENTLCVYILDKIQEGRKTVVCVYVFICCTCVIFRFKHWNVKVDYEYGNLSVLTHYFYVFTDKCVPSIIKNSDCIHSRAAHHYTLGIVILLFEP